ncbi:hypothetical protein Tco_0872223 [Tanacetum coccineum]
MDNPNITMEEYIKKPLENIGKCYGKIWYDEDVHDIRSVETEFPAIVFNDNLTSNETLSCEPTINFFKDFENEYPAIVYNDALTSKSYFLTEPAVSPQNIDEFNLKDETSLSECDEKEQNILYFNDLFPFNVIYPDDLKSDTDNDNDKIDIEQPSGDILSSQTVYTAYPNPMDTAYEGINTAYPGVWIRQLGCIVFLLITSSSGNDMDNVGGVFINLEISKCWSLEISRQLFNTLLLTTGESSGAKYQGSFLLLILFPYILFVLPITTRHLYNLSDGIGGLELIVPHFHK